MGMHMHAHVVSVFSEQVCLSVHAWIHRGSFVVCLCACAVCGCGCEHALWKHVDVNLSDCTGHEGSGELRSDYGFV